MEPTNFLPALPAPQLPTICNPEYFKPSYKSLIDSFLSGRNERTIAAYRDDLKNFCSFLRLNTKVESLDEAAELTLSHGHGFANSIALKYKTHMVERGLAPATINRRLAALRSLVKLSRTLGMVQFSLEVENCKSQSYRDTKGPGKAGFRSMLEAVARSATTERRRLKAIRDTAILHLLYDLALRRGEVVNLDLEDVDLEAGTLAVMGKGKTQKINLTLPDETKNALSKWIEVRGEDPGALFVDMCPVFTKHSRLGGIGLYLLIKKIGERAGIRCRPHGLRHAAITTALELTNGNFQSVSRFSRHANVQTVVKYDDNRLDLAGNISSLVAKSVMFV